MRFRFVVCGMAIGLISPNQNPQRGTSPHRVCCKPTAIFNDVLPHELSEEQSRPAISSSDQVISIKKGGFVQLFLLLFECPRTSRPGMINQTVTIAAEVRDRNDAARTISFDEWQNASAVTCSCRPSSIHRLASASVWRSISLAYPSRSFEGFSRRCCGSFPTSDLLLAQSCRVP